jgi:hypothetical protein
MSFFSVQNTGSKKQRSIDLFFDGYDEPYRKRLTGTIQASGYGHFYRQFAEQAV